METDNIKTMSVGEMVAVDFRTASVFKNNRIDFCCGGKKTLEQTCVELGIDQDKVEHELEAVMATPPLAGQDYGSWSPGFLCDYIMNTHHRYVLKTLPDLIFYTQKIATVHGSHHPELTEVALLFSKINGELLQHLKRGRGFVSSHQTCLGT